IAQSARRAAGRHIDRRLDQAERVTAVSGKAGDKGPVEKRGGECLKEACAWRDRENPSGHCVFARATAASAGAMASGVPTVIQCPRMMAPNSRPCSMARLK